MADEDEIYVNQKLLTELRVVDLKQELDKRGLSKTGSKHQLIERLKAVSMHIHLAAILMLLSLALPC